MLAAALVALALTGCKKSAKPAPARAIDAAAAIDGAPAADAPDEPPDLTPAVPDGRPGVQIKGLEYEGHEARMLPAIREDGARFAALAVGDDGGRGYLDLRLQLVDARTGKLIEDRVLADPEETTRALGEGDAIAPELLATVRTRVAEANALLAGSTWRGLDSVEGDPVDPEASIKAAGLDWTLTDDLHLVARRGTKVVLDRTYAQLTGKPRPSAGGDDDMCPEIIALEAIHVDAPTRTALVSLGRVPGHNCGAPGADLAVVALPP